MFTHILRAVIVIAVVFQCGAAELSAELDRLAAHVEKHRNGDKPWTINFAALSTNRASLPIGVFDSGIGGLTVMEAILALDEVDNDTLRPGPDGRPDFVGERFIYFGDQANMPYGNYPAQGREMFLRELILKDALFLLGSRYYDQAGEPPKNDKPPVKAIIIACNTATAYGLEDLRAALRRWQLDVPVIGVVEAGARAVAETLPGDGTKAAIAVLATTGTCRSEAYPRTIARVAGQAGKTAPVVTQQGSAGLAGAIEGNPAFISRSSQGRYDGPSVANTNAPIVPALWPAYGFAIEGLLGAGTNARLNSIANYARYDVVTLLETHRKSGGKPLETVVLGCTHFPLVRSELLQAFRQARAYEAPDGTRPYADAVVENVSFIDPAVATAREAFRDLARARLRNGRSGEEPKCTMFFSMPNTRAGEMERTIPVRLTPDKLPESSAALVRTLPRVWRELQR